ncbi:MAG: preprotein translocase subunit SecA, partial [Actinomycetota bacterium]|nr:preprotein translocase subunit SecA [Actinomycetota bacterium]
DVQLIGGVVLHQGKIAEMATGEGKTLVATLPLYLNALTGRGAHLVTVNNYLARRDSQWMGHVFRYLGLTVGCLDDTEPSSPERRAAYLADITYGTNNEFGFDYLRDNMVFSLEQRVQREHAYAIIDEVDSILIDEARTPLIISGPVGNETDDKYAQFDRQVAELVRKQTAVVNTLIAEAEKLLEDPKTRNDAGLKLYQARLGMPTNKRLLKMLNEMGIKQMVQRMELDAIADRKLPMKQQRMRDLEETLYFVLDEKGHSVHLTDRGAEAMSPNEPGLFLVPDISQEIHQIDKDPELTPHDRIERRRQVESDYAIKSEKLHIIHKLLQAHVLYEKEVDYLVQDGQVMIVDEFTGRVMTGRRWADGLHQAVEAKERVQVKGETQTFATITIQNYFRMYDKLAGMTGTAETEETEFYSIYGLDVSVIPTHRPITRLDQPDRIYKTRKEKHDAIMDEVERLHGLGWPILIGTVNVDVSETLSRQLKRRGLKHEVLNAKYHQREAEIVAGAGQKSAIVIATNMAGRGTDILLGGNPEMLAAELLHKKGSNVLEATPEQYAAALAEADRLCAEDRERVIAAGGLHIVGTERHEARRIDNQLRGRAGRQGDPGSTRFYLSLEDDLMRRFASERVQSIMRTLGFNDETALESRMVSRTIEGAQTRVEGFNFDTRKHVVQYDDVINRQRETIYHERERILRSDTLAPTVLAMLEEEMRALVVEHTAGEFAAEWNRDGLKAQLSAMVPTLDPGSLAAIDDLVDADQIAGLLVELVEDAYGRKRTEVGDEGMLVLERVVLLRVIDSLWVEHLTAVDDMRRGIGLRAYSQRDPLNEFKVEAYRMFDELKSTIRHDITHTIFRVTLTREAPQQRQARPMMESRPDVTGAAVTAGAATAAVSA